jgi:hypothetical protein
VKGIVINLNSFGATVRMETGELASASQGEVDAHRHVYERALSERTPLEFERRGTGRRPTIALVPQIRDPYLDEQIARYLKSAAEHEGVDAVPPHERHFLRKKKRASLFEPHSH